MFTKSKEATAIEKTDLLAVTLDGLPPTVNTLWRRGGGRTYINAEARRWKTYAAEALREWWRKEPLRGPVAVTVTLNIRNRRRMDVDNRAKAALDALTEGGVILDDSQVVDLHLVKNQGKTVTDTVTICVGSVKAG